MTQKESLYDIRLVARNLRTKQLEKNDYEAFLKKLPDEASKCVEVDLYEEPRAEEPTPHVSDDLTFTSA